MSHRRIYKRKWSKCEFVARKRNWEQECRLSAKGLCLETSFGMYKVCYLSHKDTNTLTQQIGKITNNQKRRHRRQSSTALGLHEGTLSLGFAYSSFHFFPLFFLIVLHALLLTLFKIFFIIIDMI